MSLSVNIFSVFSFFLIFMSFIMYGLSLKLAISDYSFFFEWDLISLGCCSEMTIIMDWMSLVFLGSVFLIAGSISKFSMYYMSGDKHYFRFMLLLMLFVLSMVFLIISPNMISILLGWDGLGLTSYLLVIYYQNESSCNAGMLTVLSNRVGDACILMCVGFMASFGDFFFFFEKSVSIVLCFFVVGASITKSAQIPFSAWLPAAMAAPTPVSALVHSSTLVTAGIYMIIRFFPSMSGSEILKYLMYLGIITMFMSGLGANFECDMKKVIALSTLSQLGIIMMILGAGLPELAFFHLITHAMFKSTLFMCAGVVIHMSNGSQDSRFMSNMFNSSPFLGSVFSVSNLALMGFPFLAGFYSKEAVLEYMFMSGANFFICMLVIISTGLTVSYSLRVMFFTSSGVNNLISVSDLSDGNKILVICTSLLAVMSVLSGVWFSLFYSLWVNVMVLSYISKYYILMIMLISGLLIICLNVKMYLSENQKVKMSLSIYSSSLMWFLPFISTKGGSNKMMSVGSMSGDLFEKGWLEYYGGKGGELLMVNLSSQISLDKNNLLIKNYLLSSVVSISYIIF